MKIEPQKSSFVPLKKETSAASKIENEKMATEFEQIFARQLVNEMTKGMFEMDDKNNIMGQSMNFYRYHITDALSSELAKNHEFGIADMLMKHWNATSNENKK